MNADDANEISARIHVLETITADLLLNVFARSGGVPALQSAAKATVDKVQNGPMANEMAVEVQARAVIAARKLFALVQQNLERTTQGQAGR